MRALELKSALRLLFICRQIYNDRQNNATASFLITDFTDISERINPFWDVREICLSHIYTKQNTLPMLFKFVKIAFACESDALFNLISASPLWVTWRILMRLRDN